MVLTESVLLHGDLNICVPEKSQSSIGSTGQENQTISVRRAVNGIQHELGLFL